MEYCMHPTHITQKILYMRKQSILNLQIDRTKFEKNTNYVFFTGVVAEKRLVNMAKCNSCLLYTSHLF